jgi:hypothetical protein
MTAQAELTLCLREKRRLGGTVTGMAIVAPAVSHRRMGEVLNGIEIAQRMAGLAGLADAFGEEMLLRRGGLWHTAIAGSEGSCCPVPPKEGRQIVMTGEASPNRRNGPIPAGRRRMSSSNGWLCACRSAASD